MRSSPVLMSNASSSVNAASPTTRSPAVRERIIAAMAPSTTKSPIRSARLPKPNACFARRPT